MRSFKVSVVRSMIVMVAMLMLGTSTFAQVSVTLPNVSGVAGTTGTGAITVGDLTGKNVTAFQFQISYNKSLFYITKATSATPLVGTDVTFNADTANGKILVAWAGATALTGSGNLVNLNFTFRKGGSAGLNFDNFIFNAGTPAVTLIGGGVIIPQVLIQGGTVKARVGNTIKIPIYISPITSAQNVLSYDFIATFDTTIIKITDATIIGTLSANGNYSKNIVGGKVRFAWASSSSISTTTQTTLLYLTGTAVGAGTTNLNFTSCELNTGTPLAGASAATITVKNALTLAVAPVGPNFTITDGVLFTLTLNATDNAGDVLKYSVSPSTLPVGAKLTGNVFTWTPTVAERSATAQSFTFTVTDQDTISATQKVSITVTQDYAPTLTLTPTGPYTVNEGATLSVTLVGDDKNPTDIPLLTYAVTDPATLPAGAALKANVFTWTPKFPAGRTAPYSFTFQATDPYGASGTVTISVTVAHINRAPVFTVTPDYVTVPVNTPTPLVYNFQYQAVDPDNDNVAYSLISGPNGSQIDAKTGVFTWGPTVDQAGHVYTVTVTASDGVLTAVNSQFIAATSKITSVTALNNIPTTYNLMQNYPNPFNPTTSIQFDLPKESRVKLSIFNVIGQEIQVLVNRNMSAGSYKVNFDASKLNSGMYLYRIETADYTSVRKMLLVK